MDNGASSYRRYLDGDDSGITDIIRDYKDGLTLYINSYVNNIFTAEDLMEDTFFKLAAKKPRFSGRSSFKTWLYAIARNIALDYLRKNSKVSDAPIEDLSNCIVEESNVEREYLRKEQEILLHRTMRKLKSEYFQVSFCVITPVFPITPEEAVFLLNRLYEPMSHVF
jgi:RNA polymerase sigma-70 factor (ECF subfamily)